MLHLLWFGMWMIAPKGSEVSTNVPQRENSQGFLFWSCRVNGFLPTIPGPSLHRLFFPNNHGSYMVLWILKLITTLV